jgi:hypothetical protein
VPVPDESDYAKYYDDSDDLKIVNPDGSFYIYCLAPAKHIIAALERLRHMRTAQATSSNAFNKAVNKALREGKIKAVVPLLEAWQQHYGRPFTSRDFRSTYNAAAFDVQCKAGLWPDGECRLEFIQEILGHKYLSSSTNYLLITAIDPPTEEVVPIDSNSDTADDDSEVVVAISRDVQAKMQMMQAKWAVI